jgi:ribosome biogenesis protein BMS1
MLKYTPEHMHCFGTFWGPLVAPNTGFVAVQSLSNATSQFRIAATGVVVDVDADAGGGGPGPLVKKLKLTGEPYKIFRNTAFIRGMFSSALEIAKFEGAALRTVSGVRGQIKRALHSPEGVFRATFEDKILMSDIVFLRAWYPVRPHRFYNPVTNLLSSAASTSTLPSSTADTVSAPRSDPDSAWTGMRTTGALRAAMALPTPDNPNSRYRPVTRPTRVFNPLRVPKNIASELPFRSQATLTPKRQGENKPYVLRRAVVEGGEEKKMRALMSMVGTIRREKVEKRQAKRDTQRKEFKRRMAEGREMKESRERREKEEYFRREGRKRKGQDAGDAGAGAGGGKRRK